MATLIGQDSSGNLKVETQPNEANTYLPNDYTPTRAEIAGIASDIADLETAVAAFPMIESGTTETSISVPSNSYADVEIAFTKNFSNIPFVFTTLTGYADTSYRGSMSAFVKSTTKTAAAIRIYNNTAATLSVGLNWLAIY